MLAPGDRVPDAQVWAAPRDEPVSISATLGEGTVLLCFYLWDWSPT
jgi:hypothetical protein